MSEELFDEKVALLIKLDAQRLFERIVHRAPEYINTYAVKRTREHFKDIFKSRFNTATLEDLKVLNSEAIIAADNFYSKIDDMKWYLNHTEDMPATLSDSIEHYVHDIKILYDTLNLYLEAQLSGESDELAELPPETDLD